MASYSIANKILRRIRSTGRGSVFTPKDFLDLGSRAAVDQALSRSVHRGTIRRLGRGLYDYPQVSPRLGILSPSPDAVAQVVARKTGSPLQISGARAANVLGLSTQVPARNVYLTTGASRSIKAAGQLIHLRHAASRKLAGANKASGPVFQALRYLGRNQIDDSVIRRLRRTLSASDKHALKKDAAYVPDWMRPIIDAITHT